MNASDLMVVQDDSSSVQPREIEQAIQALWRDTAGDDGDTALMQVRTLNLLVVVPSEAANPQLLSAIDAVSVQHPGRTITMLISDDEQPASAQVAIACRFGEGKTICGEQITIRSGNGGAPLPSIVTALLIAGVPTFVWWYGEPPLGSSLFTSLVENADRIIFDSRTWRTPAATLQHLAAAVRAGSSTAYTDLLWTAITPWRRLIAQCFDLPHVLPELWELEQITIEHGRSEADRIAALLLIGWLSSRLGWTIDQVTHGQIRFAYRQRSITVELHAADVSSLHRVHLHSSQIAIDLICQPNKQCIKTSIRSFNATDLERMARLPVEQLAQELGEELGVMEHDPGFEAALAVAAQILAALD